MRIRTKKLLSLVMSMIMAGSVTYCGDMTVKAETVLDAIQQDENGVYLIYTADELVEFIKNADAGIDGKLMNDITFEDGYTNESFVMNEAVGVGIEFDGNGYTISNFNVNGTKESIFYQLTDSTVKNLNIYTEIELVDEIEETGTSITTENEEETSVITENDAEDASTNSENESETETTETETTETESDSEGTAVTGMLALVALNSTIDNCKVSGKITADDSVSYIGGLVAVVTDSTILNCTNEADISAYEYVGGITGAVERSTIENCINTGDISGSTFAGGIVGIALNLTISSCTNNGAIDNSSTDEVIGYGISGIVGLACTSEISECVNNGVIGSINGNSEVVAGIVGHLGGESNIEFCENHGEIYAGLKRYASGGIVGYADSTSFFTPAVGGRTGIISIYDCINYANVSNNIEEVTEDYAGGIVGVFYSSYGTYDSYIDSTQNYGNINASVRAGGIAGAVIGASVSYCANNGTVIAGADAGAISGHAIKSFIYCIYNTGTVVTEKGVGKTMVITPDDSCEVLDAEENHVHSYDYYNGGTPATWETLEDGSMIPVDGTAGCECICGHDSGTEVDVKGIKEIYLSQYSLEYNGTEKSFPEVVVKDAEGNVVDRNYYNVIWVNSESEQLETINAGGNYEATVHFWGAYTGIWTAEINVTEVTTTAPEVTTTKTQPEATTKPIAETTTVPGGMTKPTAETTAVPVTTTEPKALEPTTSEENMESKTTAVNVKKSKVLKTTRTGKKKAKITFKKVAGATSYQIQISTSKKFKAKNTRIIKAKKTTKVINKLKEGKRYYVRVRAIKKVGGVSYKGKWSKAKNVKAKVVKSKVSKS